MERDPSGPALIAVLEGSSATNEEMLEEALDQGATELVVDLRESGSMTTRRLNRLLAARSRLLERGGRIAVVPSPRARRQFGLLGLDRRFLLAADRRQAFERLGVVDRWPVNRARAA